VRSSLITLSCVLVTAVSSVEAQPSGEAQLLAAIGHVREKVPSGSLVLDGRITRQMPARTTRTQSHEPAVIARIAQQFGFRLGTLESALTCNEGGRECRMTADAVVAYGPLRADGNGALVTVVLWRATKEGSRLPYYWEEYEVALTPDGSGWSAASTLLRRS
jgi:hypothetical protein